MPRTTKSPNIRGRTRAAAAECRSRVESEILESPPIPSPSTPRSSSEDGDGSIVYPPGCKPVSPTMPPEDLIRRLRLLASTFQAFDQEDNKYEEYIPLCMHLADGEFLNHSSRDVKVVIGCCIADVLRIFAPDAPYKDPIKLKAIIKFMLTQLTGLNNPKDPAFTRYFYLLETLSFVKAFNLCFDIEDGSETILKLFKIIFESVNEENSNRVKTHMVELLHPLVTDNERMSRTLLNAILINVVSPRKSRKPSYELAKCLIIRCSDTLETHIHNFFHEVIVYGADTTEWEDCPEITDKVYELIFELNQFCPSLVTSILPQLEEKLLVSVEKERLGCVSVLSKMFSEEGSTLAAQYPPLWKCYLSRFNDISITIRTKCVQHAMHFLVNHFHLRKDIIEALKLRQHDPEHVVRWEVVKSIVAVAKKDINILCGNEVLLDFIKERTLDKKFQIRRDALQGLAQVYKTRLEWTEVPESIATAAGWIMNRILHGYYVTDVEDKIIVEKLMNTSLVPYHLGAHDRMMALLYLYSSMDASSAKAFTELFKNLILIRRLMTEFVDSIKLKYTDSEKKLFNTKVNALAKLYPDFAGASEFLIKFAGQLKEDKELQGLMKGILDRDTNCEKCGEYINLTLKKLGAPVMTNVYYKTIKVYLERSASLLIDKEAISDLLSTVEKMVEGNFNFRHAYPVDTYVAIDKTFELLAHLSAFFPQHFDNEQMLTNLINLAIDADAGLSDEHVCSVVLTFFRFANYKPIGVHYPKLMELLTPFCQDMMTMGTPRQGKIGARCLFANVEESLHNQVFTPVVKGFEKNLDPSQENYGTAIVTLGHIGLLMPTKFKADLKKFVTQKIVKELLVGNAEHDAAEMVESNWCEEDKLSENTRCKMAGMKTTVHWLIGLKTEARFAPRAFKMLAAFVETSGDLTGESCALNDAEKSWLRLTAGCCMLKLCEQKGVGDEFTAMQYCSLSKLMVDPVPEVKTRFLARLHKGLSRGIPQKCLPLDFMGFFALGGYETDKKKRNEMGVKMATNIKLRRDYIKLLMTHGTDEQVSRQMPHIMPEYMIAFAVPVLAHSPHFTCHKDATQLKSILECVWFIMEPLVKNENFSFVFYKSILERIKGYQTAVDVNDEDATFRMHAIADIALGLLMEKASGFHMQKCITEPKVPSMYFKRLEPTWDSSGYVVPELEPDIYKRVGVGKMDTTGKNSQEKGGKTKKRKRKQGSQEGTEESEGMTQETDVSIDAQPTDAKMARLEDSQRQDSEDE